jgi:hypothetical protein
MTSLVQAVGPVELLIVRRCLAYWFLLRIVVGAFSLGLGGNPWMLDLRASAILVAVVFILVFVVVRKNHEDLLLQNLGTSIGFLCGLCFGPALAMELLVRVVA